MIVKFTKMHGAGNDYIYVNTIAQTINNPKEAAIIWSDRHKGIGADGLVLIGSSPVAEADFSMRIFNADGSEAMMCGNASRCIGKYLYERGLTDKREIKLLTLSGIKNLIVNMANEDLDSDDNGKRRVGSVTVDMLQPVLTNKEQFVGGDSLPDGMFVSMGNPHYVIFTDNVDRVEEEGPILERHPAFPQRCNIEFAHIEDDGSIRVRVWERGSGITMACGTGACATAVAAFMTGKAGRMSIIKMDGGCLHILLREEDNHVMMTGPAEFVFDGEISSNF